jgi:hypothetical protein
MLCRFHPVRVGFAPLRLDDFLLCLFMCPVVPSFLASCVMVLECPFFASLTAPLLLWLLTFRSMLLVGAGVAAAERVVGGLAALATAAVAAELDDQGGEPVPGAAPSHHAPPEACQSLLLAQAPVARTCGTPGGASEHSSAPRRSPVHDVVLSGSAVRRARRQRNSSPAHMRPAAPRFLQAPGRLEPHQITRGMKAVTAAIVAGGAAPRPASHPRDGLEAASDVSHSRADSGGDNADGELGGFFDVRLGFDWLAVDRQCAFATCKVIFLAL